MTEAGASPFRWTWDSAKLPLAIVLGLRVSLGLIGWAATLLFPAVAVPPARAQYLVSPQSPLFYMVQPWQRWDALEYVRLADAWYQRGEAQVGFYPLFPALVRVVGAVTRNDALAALLIATVAAIVALALLHRLVSQDFDTQTADRSILYLALAPTAFFLFAGYTESLFLALTVGVFVAARRGSFVIGGCLAALAVLARAQGILLVLPLIIYALRARTRRALVALLLPASAYAAHSLWLRSLGFPGGGRQIQEMFWRKTFGDPWMTLRHSVETVAANPWETMELLNLVAVVALAVAIPLMVRRKFPWPYVAYAAASGALMVWTESQYSPLQAANRYVIVVFPLFVLLGAAGRRLWVDRLVVTVFAPLQGFLFLYFVQYRFVG